MTTNTTQKIQDLEKHKNPRTTRTGESMNYTTIQEKRKLLDMVFREGWDQLYVNEDGIWGVTSSGTHVDAPIVRSRTSNYGWENKAEVLLWIDRLEKILNGETDERMEAMYDEEYQKRIRRASLWADKELSDLTETEANNADLWNEWIGTLEETRDLAEKHGIESLRKEMEERIEEVRG